MPIPPKIHSAREKYRDPKIVSLKKGHVRSLGKDLQPSASAGHGCAGRRPARAQRGLQRANVWVKPYDYGMFN